MKKGFPGKQLVMFVDWICAIIHESKKKYDTASIMPAEKSILLRCVLQDQALGRVFVTRRAI